ncbi:MAG TPA: carboxypeptidase-like regulatory domain-containing protein, partial [Longimicrobium sp.]
MAPPRVTPPPLPTEALFELVDEWRKAGHPVGVDQYGTAQELVLLLAAEGTLPRSLAGWKTLLAPILCGTPQEQRDFDHHFQRWVARLAPTIDVAVTPGPAEASGETPEPVSPSTPGTVEAGRAGLSIPPPAFRADRPFLLRFLVPAALLALLVIGTVIFYRAGYRTGRNSAPAVHMLRGIVVDPAGRPVAGARIFAASGRSVSTDSQGRFSLAFIGGTSQLTGTAAGYATLRVMVAPSRDTTLVLRLSPAAQPWYEWLFALLRGVGRDALAAVAASVLAAALIVLLRRARPPLLLRRRSTREAPGSTPVRVRGSS